MKNEPSMLLTLILMSVLPSVVNHLYAEPDLGLGRESSKVLKLNARTPTVSELYKRYKNNVVPLRANGSYFTGTIVGWKDGKAYATTHSYPRMFDSTLFVFQNGEWKGNSARVLIAAKSVAIVSFTSKKPKHLPEIDFSGEYDVGEDVFYIGNTDWRRVDQTLVKTHISGKKRKVILDNFSGENLIQIQGPIETAHSSAIFNNSGKIIGFLGVRVLTHNFAVFGTPAKEVKYLFCDNRYLGPSIFPKCKFK